MSRALEIGELSWEAVMGWDGSFGGLGRFLGEWTGWGSLAPSYSIPRPDRPCGSPRPIPQ